MALSPELLGEVWAVASAIGPVDVRVFVRGVTAFHYGLSTDPQRILASGVPLSQLVVQNLGSVPIELGNDRSLVYGQGIRIPPNSILSNGAITPSGVNVQILLERFAKAALPAAGNAGRLVELTDGDRGLWLDDGTRFWSTEHSIVDVMAYGAKGDDVTDDTAAFIAAIAALPAVRGGCVIIPPPPVAYRITGNLFWNDKPVWLLGLVSGIQPNAGVKLHVAAGITGITMQNGPLGNGANSRLENLHLVGSDVVAGVNDGVRVQCSGWQLVNVTADGFGGSGVHVLSGIAAADATINANLGYCQKVRCSLNLRHGWMVEGVDSNGGCFDGLDVSTNTGWGVFDNSFLGNTYIAPHSAGNSIGSYRVGNIGRNCRFVTAYIEVDATIAFQTDVGGAGGNYFDNAQGSNTYNLDPAQTNFIIDKRLGLHFEPGFQLGRSTAAGLDFIYQLNGAIGEILAQLGAQFRFQDSPLTTNWIIRNVGGNLQISSATFTAFLQLLNGLIINNGDPIKQHHSATAAWTPGAIAIGGFATVNIGLAGGVALGDTAYAGFSLALPAGMILDAVVTLANTVQVTLYNGTGVAQNIAAGVVRADVWGH